MPAHGDTQHYAASGLRRSLVRHRFEAHCQGRQTLTAVNAHLAKQGFKVSTDTIVDATIVGAPNSTQHRAGACDPEMHPARQGSGWHFRHA